MPSRAHHRSRVFATLTAAAAHTYLGVLGVTGLLNYTVPTPYEVLEVIASEDYWIWIHFLCALVLVASLSSPYHRLRVRNWLSYVPVATLAASFGFSMMFTWALFNLMWGLTTERPVSLAGPGLAFIVAAGEQILANAWMRGTYDKGR